MGDVPHRRFEMRIPDTEEALANVQAWAGEHAVSLNECSENPILETTYGIAAFALGLEKHAGQFASSIIERVYDRSHQGGVFEDERGSQYVQMAVSGIQKAVICGPDSSPFVRDSRAYAILDELCLPFDFTLCAPRRGSKEVRGIGPLYVTQGRLARFLQYRGYDQHVWHEDVGRGLDVLNFLGGFGAGNDKREWQGPFISIQELHDAAVLAGLCERTIKYLDQHIVDGLIDQVENHNPKTSVNEIIVRGSGYGALDAIALSSLPAIYARFEYPSLTSAFIENMIREA